MYKVSYFLGIVGYLSVMFTLLGLNLILLIKPQVSMDFGLLLLFYGLYFGVVARDFAEVCSDTMATQIGVKQSFILGNEFCLFPNIIFKLSLWLILILNFILHVQCNEILGTRSTTCNYNILIFQYYTPTGLPGKRLNPNVCGICGNQILVENNEDAIIENTCKLGCDHMYPFI